MLLSRQRLFKFLLIQHNTANIQSTCVTTTWLHSKRVQAPDWPVFSPDLSPTENFWCIMKHKLRQQRPWTSEQLKWYIKRESYLSCLNEPNCLLLGAIHLLYFINPQAAADNCHLKRLTSLHVRRRRMQYPHYVGAWDSVAWCREARMTVRNAIVLYSIPSPNAPCSIRLMVLFSRMRYPRVPGAREGRRGP